MGHFYQIPHWQRGLAAKGEALRRLHGGVSFNRKNLRDRNRDNPLAPFKGGIRHIYLGTGEHVRAMGLSYGKFSVHLLFPPVQIP